MIVLFLCGEAIVVHVWSYKCEDCKDGQLIEELDLVVKHHGGWLAFYQVDDHAHTHEQLGNVLGRGGHPKEADGEGVDEPPR